MRPALRDNPQQANRDRWAARANLGVVSVLYLDGLEIRSQFHVFVERTAHHRETTQAQMAFRAELSDQDGTGSDGACIPPQSWFGMIDTLRHCGV